MPDRPVRKICFLLNGDSSKREMNHRVFISGVTKGPLGDPVTVEIDPDDKRVVRILANIGNGQWGTWLQFVDIPYYEEAFFDKTQTIDEASR